MINQRVKKTCYHTEILDLFEVTTNKNRNNVD